MRSNLTSTSIEIPGDVGAAIARVAPRLGQIACEVVWLPTTGSTNDVAASLAEGGAAEGTTVVADVQTSGRGRHGRVWFSPPGAGLYVSVILRPSRSPALLTLASGVAIAEALRATTGLPVNIKWPNDLIIGKRKVAGILAESVQTASLQFVVLGFGINLQTAAYPAELARTATSIEAETNRAVDRGVIFAEVLAKLAERYDDLQRARFDAILTAWRDLAPGVRNAVVEWDAPAGVLRGRAIDIDGDGALLVQIGDRTERIVAGVVRWM